MVQKDISVEGEQNGDGVAEVVGITIRTSEEESRKIILMFMLTKCWENIK